MKRETTITIGGKTITADYDEMLADVNSLARESVQAAMEILCDDFYWIVALPWIGAGKIRKEAFLGHFQECTKQRMMALNGDKVVGHEPEFDFLSWASAYAKSGRRSAASERLIGLRFMEFMKEGHVPFSKMAKILKAGQVDAGRGGFKTTRGKLLLAFCELHMDTENLPRRGEILDRLDLCGEKRKQARRDLEYLGFKGLAK